MMAKKKPAKKVKKQKVRVPSGFYACGYDSVATIIEVLIHKGFRMEDLEKTSIVMTEHNEYQFEGDSTQHVCVVWDDIY